MTKTIIFDLGGVLFSDGTRLAAKEYQKAYGVSSDLAIEALEGEIGSSYRAGKITVDEFWNGTKKLWGINVDSAILQEMWLSQYKLNKDVKEILVKLRKNGYELLYMSDNVLERVEYLEQKYGFIKLFDNGAFSYDVGIRKPSMIFYEQILKISSNSAENCIYIDDKSKLLKQAEQLGMKGIVFENSKQLVKELEKLGINL